MARLIERAETHQVLPAEFAQAFEDAVTRRIRNAQIGIAPAGAAPAPTIGATTPEKFCRQPESEVAHKILARHRGLPVFATLDLRGERVTELPRPGDADRVLWLPPTLYTTLLDTFRHPLPRSLPVVL